MNLADRLKQELEVKAKNTYGNVFLDYVCDEFRKGEMSLELPLHTDFMLHDFELHWNYRMTGKNSDGYRDLPHYDKGECLSGYRYTKLLEYMESLYDDFKLYAVKRDGWMRYTYNIVMENGTFYVKCGKSRWEVKEPRKEHWELWCCCHDKEDALQKLLYLNTNGFNAYSTWERGKGDILKVFLPK